MNKVIDFSTLMWVKNELEQTLREARQSLEAHVETPADRAQLDMLAGHLHQVFGTLQMVELYGAALLAEEMEQVGRAIADDSASQHDDAGLAPAALSLQQQPGAADFGIVWVSTKDQYVYRHNRTCLHACRARDRVVSRNEIISHTRRGGQIPHDAVHGEFLWRSLKG